MVSIKGQPIEFENPRQLGLSNQTSVGRLADGSLVLIKDRRSRIIMKDGERLLEQVCTIRQREPEVNVLVCTTAPVCSKTRSFLKRQGIDVVTLD